MNLSQIINQLGEEREQYFNAITPPIIQTSNFKFDSIAQMRDFLKNEFDHHCYSRGNNPTVEILRKKLAALEGTENALVLSSGISAISTAVFANLKAGDHVVCVKQVYSWTKTLFDRLLPRFGVETTFVDGKNIANFKNAIRPNTTLFYLESPTTMLFELQDIEAVCNLAKQNSITTILENTYASPLYQQPVKMGVDVVVHTASKYLSGHSDVIAGVICASEAMIRKIFATEFLTFGTILSPNDAWLFMRGLRTLEIRLERISKSTKKVISFLEAHEKVEKVIYPFSPNNAQLDLAKKQMTGMGGLFSFLLKTNDVEEIEAFCNRMRLFNIAVSWGGYESLILPVCATVYTEKQKSTDLPINLIRLYVGLENPDDLIADLQQSLELVD